MDRNGLISIVEYAYAALDQNVAQQTIDMSIDFIVKVAPQDMATDDVRRIISAALDTTENRRLNPKWFGDVIRSSRSGVNRAPRDDEHAGAPRSNGSESDDFKCNFLAMVAVALTFDYYETYTSSNAGMHAWLVSHGIIREQSGDMARWKVEAEDWLSQQHRHSVTVRDFIVEHNPQEHSDAQIIDTAYMLCRRWRISQIVEKIRSGEVSVDAFCAKINELTPETKPAYIILTNDNYKFKIQ